MKVLHVVDTLGVGGAELSVAKVIERGSAGATHQVCCIRSGGATAARLAACGIAVSELRQAPGSDWRLALRIARLCRRVRPDVVHTRNWGSIEGVIGARLARVPVVIHAEHGFNLDDVEGGRPVRNRVRRALGPFIDRVVAVSDDLRDWLVRVVGLRPAKVTVVRDGVDVARFRPLPGRERMRRTLGCAPDAPVLACVARLDPVKDHVTLLAAARLLRPRHPCLRLLLIGDGPQAPALQRQAAELGVSDCVTFLGGREDVADVLNACDVFCLPSLFEGTCNAILEAMAVGLPVVATSVGGNPEVVDAGTTGRLVPARDAEALATAVGAYFEDGALRAAHGAAGRARVQRRYSLEQMVAGYLTIYHEELARRGRGHATRDGVPVQDGIGSA